MADSAADLSYCGQAVRKYDNDRFLVSLFAPADRREALFALYAFNLEVAKTREVVTDATLGYMRLQWWRDCVDGIYGGGAAPRHEVVQPVAAAVEAFGLTRDHFERLIDGREADLQEEGPATLAELEAYVEATAVPLARLSLEALGVRDEGAVEAGRHVAIAQALAGLLRSVPFHARQHRVMLPADRMAAHGLAARSVLEFKPGPELRPVVREVVDLAHDHLKRARALRRSVPRAALPALLPAVLTDRNLGRLERAGCDAFDRGLFRPDGLRHARLAWAALRGRY